MDIVMIILLIFIVYMTINNFKQIGANKHQKKYVEAYRKMLNDDSDAYDFVCEYLKEETDQLFKNKALIILAGEELKKGSIDECKKTIDNLDIKILFYKNDKLNFNEYVANSDSFLWLIYIELVAYKNNQYDVVEYVIDKFKDFDTTLSKFVEYTVFKSIGIALTKGMSEDTKIFKLLLDGEYSAYQYDKRVIGLYKRLSAMTLLYKKEEVEETWVSDQSSFTETLIGKAFTTTLGVYDKYHKEEPKEEETTEENGEDKKVEVIENKTDEVEKVETEVVDNKEETEKKDEN